MVEVKILKKIPSGNPFNSDLYHMGTTIGENVTVMYKNFKGQHQEYIIVINTRTGERVRVKFGKE